MTQILMHEKPVGSRLPPPLTGLLKGWLTMLDSLNAYDADIFDMFVEYREEAVKYTRSILSRMAIHKLGLDLEVIAHDIPERVLIKTLNAEEAITKGHATIRGGKVSLTDEAKCDTLLSERYAQGMRVWHRDRLTFRAFFKLVILSECRNLIRHEAFRGRSSEAVTISLSDVEQESSFATSPERVAAIRLGKSKLLSKIEDAELRRIAEHMLFQQANIADLALSFGLTESQIRKRISKILLIAKNMDLKHNN